MSKTFIISDTHFYHRNIVKLENRPENFNELIIDNWNNIVTDQDTIIHLGDFALTSSALTKQIISKLNGKKILVRGNHDKSTTWFMDNGFNFVCTSFSLRHSNHHILFTHIKRDSLEGIYDINVHGHSHSKGAYTRTHKCFSIEVENYLPVELDSFINRKV